MTSFQAIILGLVQGLTEFIPVSSTGHLVLVRELLGLPVVGSVAFDAVLQLATALAVIIYFWKDLIKLFVSFFRWPKKLSADSGNHQLIKALIVGTIPAVILGLLLEKAIDTSFRQIWVVATTLLLGSALFWFAERYWKKNHESTQIVTAGRGLVVGLFQCLALLPGFSRSGATISGGLLAKLNRETAARFSFLLALPVILGSGLKKLFDLYSTGVLSSVETSLLLGSLAAFLSGLMSIHYLLKFLKGHSLNWFGAYRVVLAVIILFTL